MGDSDLLLNYHDACVYRSDLSLLESPTAWLNDACINFQMTRLSRRRRRPTQGEGPARTAPSTGGGATSSGTNDGNDDHELDDSNGDANGDIIFLDPSVVSYMMYQCDDEDLTDLCRGWDLHQHPRGKKGLLVPVNDHHAADSRAFRTPGGGNHWSMMLIVVLSGASQATTTPTRSSSTGGSATQTPHPHPVVVERCLHFDSSGGYNASAAIAVAARLQRAISLTNVGNGARTSSKPAVAVTECRAPQQTNGYDCGVFALGAAEALSVPLLWVGGNGAADNASMEKALQDFVSESGSADFARNMRNRVSKDIRMLAGMIV